MVKRFGRQRLSCLAFVVVAEIDAILLDVGWTNALQNRSREILFDVLRYILIVSNSRGFVVSTTDLQRQPCILNETNEIVFALFGRQLIRKALGDCRLFLLVFGAGFLFPFLRRAFCCSLGLCGGQSLWGCPCYVFPYLFALCISLQTNREAVRYSFSVLLVLSDVSQFKTLLTQLFCGFETSCALFCALFVVRLLEKPLKSTKKS